MWKIGAILAILAFLCAACEKKEENPEYSGEISLSSEILPSGPSYIFYGFSFETGKISTYSLTGGAMPDLAVVHVELEDSVNIDLQGSDDREHFFLNGVFTGPQEAENFFNHYTEVTATSFQPIAYNIKENQVWTVQTTGKKFAKIWIREITVMEGGQSFYAVLLIRYVYQPDGTRIFP